MDDRKLQAKVVTHLQQVHAAERAQLGELHALHDESEIAAVKALLLGHEAETRRQVELIEARLGELEASGSLRLLTQALGASLPKLALDRLRPDSECAILRDAVIAEAGEVVSYLLLETEALRAGDDATAVLAREIGAQERETLDVLDTFWNQSVHIDVDRRAGLAKNQSRTQVIEAMLVDHLRDVHALERNAVIMLGTVLTTVHDELALERVRDHQQATVRHGDEIARRLHELGSGPSARKVAQGLAFAAVKGPINIIRRERAAKDLRDMFVVEHMEAVAYEQLAVLAELVGDDRTLRIAQDHLAEERAMATWLERDAARFLLETLYAEA
ncbi:MAG: yciE [Thermoleophilia bacterium]|nr:yciE [Thermoleophilia bacterium]